MRQQVGRLSVFFAFVLLLGPGIAMQACGSSTEIPTVAEDPWARPDEGNSGTSGEHTDNEGDVNTGEPRPACGSGGTCDPDNLGGETCATLGMGDGTLACDPVTCTYDTSMCEAGNMGGGGNGNTGTGTGNNNNAMAGAGGSTFFGGGNNGGNNQDGGTPFFGGNFFGGQAGMNGNAGNGGNGGTNQQPPFFGGNFFGGGADGGTPFFGGGFFGGGADGGTGFFGGGFFGGGADGGTGFFGGGFFGGGFFGGGNNPPGEDPMDAGI